MSDCFLWGTLQGTTLLKLRLPTKPPKSEVADPRLDVFPSVTEAADQRRRARSTPPRIRGLVFFLLYPRPLISGVVRAARRRGSAVWCFSSYTRGR